MTDKILNSSCCALPFMHMQTEPDGKIKLCCLAKSYVTNDEGSPYNFGTDDVNEIFNSNYMRRVRKDMLNGIQVPDCQGCYDEEAAGGISQRQSYTQEWLDREPELASSIVISENNDYMMDPKIKYFDFRFGNMCNLKCRSCGPINSNQLLKETREIEVNNPRIREYFLFDDREVDTINEWYQTDKFIENFRKQEDNIRQLYCTGGEPTIIEQNYQILKELVDNNKSSEVSLIFSSNMTNIQERFINLISHFKKVTFLASCEGYGEVQEYLRYPAKWSVFEKNIRRLASLDPDKITIMCTPVVQSVNLDKIVDFFKWIVSINDEYGYRRIQTLPIVLTFPYHLDLEILPLEMKQRSLAKIEEFVNTCPRLYDDVHFTGRINMLRDKCNKDVFNPNELLKFKEFTTMLDNHRGQTLETVNPELYKLIQEL